MIGDIIRQQGSVRPDEVAVSGQGRRSTFGEIDARSSQVAQGLLAAGVQEGDRIAILAMNRTDIFDVLFGAAKVGAVPVPINFRLAPPELAALLADSGARIVFAEEAYRAAIATSIAGDGYLTTAYFFADQDVSAAASEYDSWREEHVATDPGISSGPSDLSIMLYSSGTTGLPKGVMLTNSNLAAMLDTGAQRWVLAPGDSSLTVSPYFHILGIAWTLHVLRHGAIVAQVRDAVPTSLLGIIVEEKVAIAVLVPALIAVMLASPDLDSADLSHLRLLVYGAAPISAEMMAAATSRLSCEFEQSWGLTENTGGAAYLSPEDHRRAVDRPELLRACGRTHPTCELRIVDPHSLEEVETGTPGEVLIKSAQVMAGYWNRPEETAHALLPDGWLRSGDIGYLDAEGYLYLVDRAKDMIVSGGENIFPAEIENVLAAHPSVAEATVIAVPSNKWGESPHAIVVLHPAADPTTADPGALIGWCRDRLAHYKCPVSVSYTDTLPRNPTGKILKRVLREPYWVGRDRRVG